jgi:tetratricopeptide (TPR) repeat protein
MATARAHKKPSRPLGRPRPGRRAAARKLLWPAAAGLLLLAAGAGWLLRPRPEAPPPPPVHPAERLSAAEATYHGLLLARAGRALAAIPYFRSALALSPASWSAHVNYAAALGNGAQEARLHLGREEIATRGSVERVAMVVESLQETEAAERLAAAPADRATVLGERARVLYTWGFPLDALAVYRAAAALAPERRALREALERVEGELRERPIQ